MTPGLKRRILAPGLGFLLLSAQAVLVSAGQVTEDPEDSDGGARPVQRLPSTAPASQPTAPPQQRSGSTRKQFKADTQATASNAVDEVGRAIGQAIVESISQHNQTNATPPSRQNREPEPTSQGGRRAKGERF